MKFSLDISFSWSDLLCFPFYIFPLLLCTAHVRRPSYLYLLFSEVVFSWVYLNLFFGLFSPCFLLHIFPQLCVRPLQTKTLLSCIPLSLSLSFFGWFWLLTGLPWWFLTPAQCYEPVSIVLQALSLPDLILWIYWSPLLYYHKCFDLVHTWMA